MPHAQRARRDRGHLLREPLPIGGRALAVLVAVLTAVILLLVLVQDAKGTLV